MDSSSTAISFHVRSLAPLYTLVILQKMETAITAVAGELVSRIISFTINKYYGSKICLEEEVERLKHLLMRVHTVVEEADARYITNSGMLMQLKVLSEAMYRGYHALDTFKFQLHKESSMNKVSNSLSFSSANPLKRPRTIVDSTNKGKVLNLKVHGALGSLETIVANIAEFVSLLGGCERMSRRPYDAYLYIDNFMFGRLTEKQKLLNFLLDHNPPGAPAVLPIIGGLAFGKKTLVAHVCADERVRSHFSSILHLNGDNFLTVLGHERAILGMQLVVVEFVSEVDDVDWKAFYSFVTRTNRRSKVIIISKLERLARFGSVRPIFLNSLSYEEFWYLFKILAFGSANPSEHPRLVQIAEEFAMDLHMGGSLVAANALAEVLRGNLNAQLWLCILDRCRRVIDRNLSVYGEHLNLRLDQGHEVDLRDFSLHPASPLRIIPCTGSRSTTYVPVKKELPQVTFAELLVDPSVRPKGEFNLLSWESRLPPYTSFVHFAPNCTQDMPEGRPLSGRKRRGVTF
ncbi:putative disease resistance protein RGA4 [Phragmites australis]|uniref:putative disease resistance protein RGA4 n=1 Tax=Phragmites australis TaxID=29695 RepID=UPI002D7884B3|nr:putative disease resistance protein RGA4 [Phragmites australis]